MYKRKQGLALGRFLVVFAAVAIVVSGVTFAALQSQAASLKGSRITSATASLQIGDGQGGFGATANGFEFNNVEPGGSPQPTPGHMLTLKNNGTSNLALKAVMNPNSLANPNNANLDKVYINLTAVSGIDAGRFQQFTLASLLAAYNNGGLALDLSLAAGQTAQYHMQIQMAADSVTSVQSAVGITGIDLIFSGTTVVN